MYLTVKDKNYRKHRIIVKKIGRDYDYWYCGYVEIPKDHKYYGVDYTEILDDFDVHGGLTFSGELRDTNGFFLGFDCNHYGDNPRIQDDEYTLVECIKLVDQIVGEE